MRKHYIVMYKKIKFLIRELRIKKNKAHKNYKTTNDNLRFKDYLYYFENLEYY
ncbi:hypothetical protein pb186bvf_015764 [Paramecium bursaria]